MVAGGKETAFEVAVKMITAPIWLPIYFAYLGCRKVAETLAQRRVKPDTAELSPVWMPATDIERTVFAALILAGEPINNRRLAELMGCSPGEASKRVARLEGVVRKVREGREVRIGLH